jgi:lipopolysaccharide transport system permease protein
MTAGRDGIANISSIRMPPASTEPPRGGRLAFSAVRLESPGYAMTEATTQPIEFSTETIIQHRSGWIPIDWKELIAYHELLLFLIWRDMSARYKQTILGGLWAVVQPLIMMVIFTVIFGSGRLNLPIPKDLPYPVFVFAGLIPWSLFSQGFSQSALSLVNQQHLLTKVYFPRIFVPVSAAAVFIIDLLISLGIYGIILAYYRIAPSWTIVFVPLLIVMTYIATLSLGLLISALTVFYRDFRHLVPFMTQILLYTSAVFMSTSNLSPKYRAVLALNPIFGIIDAFRAALLGLPCDFVSLAISSTSACLLFTFGLFYFSRTERKFADFA